MCQNSYSLNINLPSPTPSYLNIPQLPHTTPNYPKLPPTTPSYPQLASGEQVMGKGQGRSK